MIAWLFATTALGFTEEEVLDRVAEVQPHLALRIAESPPTVPEEVFRKAARGKIATGLIDVEGHRAKKAYGVGILDVGIRELWAGINDETSHPGWTAVTYAELVQGDICQTGRATFMFLPVPMVADRWWITHLVANDEIWRATDGQVRELAWSSSVDPEQVRSEAGRDVIAQGIPLAFTIGAWFLIALDESHTLMEYDIWTDPGGRIPARAASVFAAGSLKDTFEAMESYAKAGVTHCPIE